MSAKISYLNDHPFRGFGLAAAVLCGAVYLGWSLSPFHSDAGSARAARHDGAGKAKSSAATRSSAAFPGAGAAATGRTAEPSSEGARPEHSVPQDGRSRNAGVMETLKGILKEIQATEIPTDPAECRNVMDNHPALVAMPVMRAFAALPDEVAPVVYGAMTGSQSGAVGGVDLRGFDMNAAENMVRIFDQLVKASGEVTAQVEKCAFGEEKADKSLGKKVVEIQKQYQRLSLTGRDVGVLPFQGRTEDDLKMYEQQVAGAYIRNANEQIRAQGCQEDILLEMIKPFGLGRYETFAGGQGHVVGYQLSSTPFSPYTAPMLESFMPEMKKAGFCPPSVNFGPL